MQEVWRLMECVGEGIGCWWIGFGDVGKGTGRRQGCLLSL